jgi:hypothetical protein
MLAIHLLCILVVVLYVDDNSVLAESSMNFRMPQMMLVENGLMCCYYRQKQNLTLYFSFFVLRYQYCYNQKIWIVSRS